MTGYTFVRRSMMAVSFAGDGYQAVDHAQAAIETPDVPVHVRGLAAKQLAFGQALSKDGDASARALDQAMELLARSSDDEADGLGQRSVVSDDLHNIFRATCDIYLGRGDRAIVILEPRLAVVAGASPRTPPSRLPNSPAHTRTLVSLMKRHSMPGRRSMPRSHCNRCPPGVNSAGALRFYAGGVGVTM